MSFVKDGWDILKDIATGAKKLRQGRRERQERARQERDREVRRQVSTVEESFENELAAYQQQLTYAETDEERAHIRQEMSRVSRERAVYYRASREVNLPQEITDRMGALGIRANMPSDNPTKESGQ